MEHVGCFPDSRTSRCEGLVADYFLANADCDSVSRVLSDADLVIGPWDTYVVSVKPVNMVIYIQV